MYRYLIFLLGLSWHASAHEFTPTYPKLKQSYVEGVLYTTMTLFNKRTDVQYYELGVFDAEWNKIPFAVEENIMLIKHLETKEIDVFIREKDKDEAVYICSKSKLVVDGNSKTSLSSRICSKIQ